MLCRDGHVPCAKGPPFSPAGTASATARGQLRGHLPPPPPLFLCIELGHKAAINRWTASSAHLPLIFFSILAVKGST